MNAEAVALIEALAAKLGTTADHLWGVLVNQAPISAAIHALVGITLIAAFVACAKQLRHNYRLMVSEDTEGEVVFYGISVLVLGIASVIFLAQLDVVVAGFFNPEYWALHRLLSSR